MNTKRIIFFLAVTFLAISLRAGSIENNLSFDHYFQENGLSSNQVSCIFQDRKGWMWFGSSQGLNRFDGYRFAVYQHNPNDSTSLVGNLVRVIWEDKKGDLFIGTENGGLNIYNRDSESFSHFFNPQSRPLLHDVSVNALAEDEAGNIWIGTSRQLLVADATGNVSQVKLIDRYSGRDFGPQFIRILTADNFGKLWLGTNDGIFVFDPADKHCERIELPFGRNQNREIWEIFKDDDGKLWVGTYACGAYIVDPATTTMIPVVLDYENERSTTVRTISKDNAGQYWIGTRGGAYVYNKSKGITACFRQDERQVKSLSNNSVLDIFHDSNGDAWIGTRNGINFLVESKQVFKGFSAMPGDNHFLNSSVIYAFWIDQQHNIWIGTEDGGINIYNRDKGTFQYKVNTSGPNSISENCIKAFLDDGQGNLWIGTYLGGIDILNLNTGKISHFKHNDHNPASLADNRVWDICMDSRGQIWVGTTSGLDRFDKATNSFVHYVQVVGEQWVNWIKEDSERRLWIGTIDEVIVFDPSTGRKVSFPEHSRGFCEDSEKQFWIATIDKGLALYEVEKGAIRYWNENDGLANNQALCVLQDDRGFLWISTSNGLSRFDKTSGSFQNFSSKDGLQNNQFCYGAAYKTKSGELLFGGISGFNIFDPNEVKEDNFIAPMVLTDFRIFNKSVPLGKGNDAILTKSISETDQVTLRYSQNVFTLEFAALNYGSSPNTLYSYFLDGFDKDWTEPATGRTATYTNLDPGDYVFKVKSVVPGAPLSDEGLSFAITVLPPYWKTLWFKIMIVLTIFGLIFLLIQFFITREKWKNELTFERIRAKKLHELDMLKLRFFTNISHEIRTPLTLIMAPLEKLIAKKVPDAEIPSHLEIMHRNTTQLNRLINQLLDFRKLESGSLKLEFSQGDIVRFLGDVVHSFEAYAAEKEIELRFNSSRKRLVTSFDADKLEKIVNNLLSNALKFTGKGGHVSVNLSLVFDSDDDDLEEARSDKQFIEISVRDTGTGISEKNTGKIFNRFFQAGEKNEATGTGIGLALVKELVKLHNGKIFVSSKPGKGSRFTVHLPYDENASVGATITDEQQNGTREGENHSADMKMSIEDVAHARIMLVVEDNADVRFVIRGHFAERFKVIEASNGQEGWEKALETIPDVIISDILMPDVDGFEFCQRLKKDERTSHIPVLLLTALHSREHEMQGLSYGADDYITKPFDLSILQTKIENILSIRQSLKQKYSEEIVLQPKNIVLTSPDEKFLQKAIEVVENNIADADLDIKRFAAEVGVSRMQLYRKLNALTDMTVKEFIRNIRLKRAVQLLEQKNRTISEIAWEVGFKDISHFRKCFRQMYGMNASEYSQHYKDQTDDETED